MTRSATDDSDPAEISTPTADYSLNGLALENAPRPPQRRKQHAINLKDFGRPMDP